MKTHTEDTFEKLIVEHLVLHGGYKPRGQTTYDPDEALAVPAGYDVHRAMIPTEVIAFVQAHLKNPMTGRKAGHTRRQYKENRDPKVPLFRFKARALVHFAVDTDEVWMTTRLRGLSTRFLPFNRGYNNGAGNPPVEGRHRTCYLWEDVWQRDSLLDLVGRFIHLQKEKKTNPNTGKVTTTETMIFPRYH